MGSWTILKTRIRQGYRTLAFPRGPLPALPERFRGRPRLDPARCPGESCGACVDACPTRAVTLGPLTVDLGACLFCPTCTAVCPNGAIAFTNDFRLATRAREDLRVTRELEALAQPLEEKIRKLFGRSLKLRQVSAGGCNGCEADLSVLGINVFDLGRFGIQFVASPRHADGVVITGPVTRNMALALRETYDAIPAPKLVIAVGACAIAGGPFAGSGETEDGVAGLPIDLFVPGCPPHPLTTLDGLLRLLGRIER